MNNRPTMGFYPRMVEHAGRMEALAGLGRAIAGCIAEVIV